jgi:ubiquinone/menaquinone biosynthesis C-methylase UbiE
MNQYIKTIYSNNARPLNNYPQQLVNYLINTFKLKDKSKFLEIGTGRGDHLKLFKNSGFEVYGLDLSDESAELNPEINIQTCNLSSDKIPFIDNYFDIIYSKSFIEHLDSPNNFIKEAYRVLKPGGVILTLVPDWESNMKIYFDDYTHKTPYTIYSLKDLYLMNNFKNINVYKFRQLPIIWKLPWLNIICSIIAFFTPHRSKIKFLRWSKELMIIGYAEK